MMSGSDPNDRYSSSDESSETRGSNSKNGRSSSGKRDSRLVVAPKPTTQAKGGSQYGDLSLAEIADRLRSLFSIVRNRWIAAVVAAVLVGGSFGYFSLRTVPEHTAVSTMLAQSALDELLKSTSGPRGGQKDAQENFLQNHLSVMQSRRFSVALAAEFTEKEKKAIIAPILDGRSEASMATFVNLLASRSGAERQRDREFFTLRFRHPNPDIAIMVADRMTAAYLKLVQQEIKETNLSAAEMLRVQAEQLQAEISQLEGKQRDFREKHNIVTLEESSGLLAERLQRIDRNRSESRIKRFHLETQLKDAKRDMLAETLPFENLFLANFANNQKLKQSLDGLSAEREVLALRYGKNHPKMKAIDGQILGISENLKRNFDLAYRDLENQYQNLVAVEQQLDREFKEEFGEGIEIGHLSNQFLVIGSEVDAKREALRDLLRRVSNAVVVSNLPTDVMRVVDPAYIVKPKLAKQKVSLVITVFLGMASFFGTPLILHIFDQRLKCTTDIEEEFGKPLLGGVPRLSRIKNKDRPHVISNDVGPSKVEPFMTVIAQIELMSSQSGTKSFVLTSTARDEGKSTISANLAVGFAQIGRKTLIIDGDLRRPCQHQFHSVRKECGLLWWAEAGYPEEDLFSDASTLGIQKLPGGCYILPAGGVYPQPAQFLVSEHVKKLFKRLEEHFDIILVDTPPVGLYPDAQVLAQSVGETILIAREATAPINQIRQVMVDIDNTAAPVLGIVLNDYSRGSLNPRLAYKRTYDSYNYVLKDKTKAKRKERAAPSGKTLVSKLMAEKKDH